MLVKLGGREAPSVLQKHTCWLPDADGVLQRHWRLGRHKSWPAYRWEAQIKYLGTQISYGNFEKQALHFRIDLFRLHSIQDPVDKLRDTPTERSTITDSRSHGLTLLSALGSPSRGVAAGLWTSPRFLIWTF